MRLRTRLFLLVAGTVIPLDPLAVVLGALLVGHERETFRKLAIDRNRAFMSAVDAEIRGDVSTLQALAANSSLRAGNPAGLPWRSGAGSQVAARNGERDPPRPPTVPRCCTGCARSARSCRTIRIEASLKRSIGERPARGGRRREMGKHRQIRHRGARSRDRRPTRSRMRALRRARHAPVRAADEGAEPAGGLGERARGRARLHHRAGPAPPHGWGHGGGRSSSEKTASAPEGWYRGSSVPGARHVHGPRHLVVQPLAPSPSSVPTAQVFANATALRDLRSRRARSRPSPSHWRSRGG